MSDLSFRLLLRHPPGLEPAEASGLEIGIRAAVQWQQEAAGKCAGVRPIEELRVDDRGFFLREAPPGAEDLESLLGRQLEPGFLVDLGCQLCDVLAAVCYAPSGEIRPHGAIRPPCLFLADGRLLVSDFGLAGAVAKSVAPSAPPEEIDLLAAYTAPELWLNPTAVGELKDLFSVGVVLYELATGAHPYGVDRRDVADCERMVVIPEPRPAAKANPALPSGLARVLDKAVSHSEQARFPSLRAMREALAVCLTSPPASVAEVAPQREETSHPEPAQQAQPSGKSRKVLRSIAAVATLVGLVLTVGLLWPQPKSPCPGFDALFEDFDKSYRGREHDNLPRLLVAMKRLEDEIKACEDGGRTLEELRPVKEKMGPPSQNVSTYARKMSHFDDSKRGPSDPVPPKLTLDDMIGLLNAACEAWPTAHAQKLLSTAKSLGMCRSEFETHWQTDLLAAKRAYDECSALASGNERFKERIEEDKNDLLQAADGDFEEAKTLFDEHSAEAPARVARFVQIAEALQNTADEARKATWHRATEWKGKMTAYQTAVAAAEKSATLVEMETHVRKAYEAWPDERTAGALKQLEATRPSLDLARQFYEEKDWRAVGFFVLNRSLDESPDALQAAIARIVEAERNQWIQDRLTEIRVTLPEAGNWLAEHPAPAEPSEQLRRIEDAVQARKFLDQMSILPPTLGGETVDGLLPAAMLSDAERTALNELRKWTRVTIKLKDDVPLTVLAVPGKGNLISPRWLGETELTVRQFQAIAGVTDWPREVRESPRGQAMIGNPNHPIAYLSFDDARKHMLAVTIHDDITVRLPTREEWLHAMLTGQDDFFYANPQVRSIQPSDGFDRTRCNFDSIELRQTEEDVPRGAGRQADGHGRYAPVGSYDPNRWGFLDMFGNVSEWVEDRSGQWFACGGSWLGGYAPEAAGAEHCPSGFDKSRPFEYIGVRIVVEAGG